jgi:peptidoglycan/LPS O-acetylase OafA/YrhL
MNKSTSLYLDFLRVVAAFGVLLVHASLPWFSNNLFLSLNLGHKLVMVFFVLSGYLIAFTVDKKNKGSQPYLIDRFSRLYSVVIPALIFTYALDFVGKNLNPTFYLSQISPNHQAVRFLLNVSFLSQIWNLCSIPSSNGPFWSISYEFWYYMLFWAAHYLKGRWKYIAFVAVALLVSVKILVLFPIWLLGVIAYRLTDRFTISPTTARIIFTATLMCILILTFVSDFSLLSTKFIYGEPPLYFSSNFIYDWVYGLLVAVNILSINYVSFIFKMPEYINRVIKYLSSITFSLYLYHFPILVFIASVINYNKSSYIQITLLLLLVLAVIAVLSEITEKHRGNLKTVIKKIFLIFSQQTNNNL